MGEIKIISREAIHFNDRSEAGRLLVRELTTMDLAGVVVLGIPRGGLEVAQEIAAVLGAPLDVVLTRKLAAPQNPELAIASVNEHGEVFRKESLIRYLKVSDNYLERERKLQLEIIKQRASLIRHILPRISLAGRTVILTDDGVATGATMQAAVWSVLAEKPTKLIVALPVAPRGVLAYIAQDADNLLCLAVPPEFISVSQFYQQFPQLSNEEMMSIISRERERRIQLDANSR